MHQWTTELLLHCCLSFSATVFLRSPVVWQLLLHCYLQMHTNPSIFPNILSFPKEHNVQHATRSFQDVVYQTNYYKSTRFPAVENCLLPALSTNIVIVQLSFPAPMLFYRYSLKNQ